MDRLWTPWRYQYISSAPAPPEGCIFCTKPAAQDDEANLILHRGRHAFALLNLFPYNNGHLMVAPYAHAATLEEIDQSTADELFALTRHAEALLRRVYRPQGINIGMNIGSCAGAGVAGHIHMHLLPRWVGDAGFITTVGETRVLPEELSTTLRRLKEAW
ncbi:MAG: HIT domain-containing protein [Acidobacteria bacterium]|nr:HIT domain-containing protein [Acidobacteriota bacterium]